MSYQKILSVFLLPFFVFSLLGCQSGSEEPTIPEGTEENRISKVSEETISESREEVYTHKTLGFSFPLQENWRITDESDEGTTITVDGYRKEGFPAYELRIRNREMGDAKSFDEWMKAYKEEHLSPPFSKRECKVSVESDYAHIAYCDFGGVTTFVIKKDESQILSLGLGQDFPSEVIGLEKLIQFDTE